MKTLGFILIVAGIVMIIIKGFSVETEKRVVDLGPVQVNKKENKWIGWPSYAGAMISLIGVVLVVSDKRRTG
jgi:drug/metabolite transporter (DMT)-like permease